MLNELKDLNRKKTESAAKALLTKAINSLKTNLPEGVGLIHTAFKKNKDFVLPFVKNIVLEKIEKKEIKAALNIGNVLLKHCPNEYLLANTLGNCARRCGKFNTASSFYKQAYQAERTFELAYLNLGACEARVNLYDQKIKAAIAPFKKSGRFLIPSINYYQNPKILNQIYEKICLVTALNKIEEIQIKVFEENIGEGEVQFKELNDKVELIRENLAEKLQKGAYAEKLEIILNQAEKFDWKFFNNEEKNTLKWEIYHYAVNYLQSHKVYLQRSDKEGGTISTKTIEFIRQLLLTLRIEHCHLYYLEMVMAIILYAQGKITDSISIFENLLKNDASNRFYNVNLGLIYSSTDNKRLGVKHLLIGWQNIRSLAGKYQIFDLIELASQKHKTQDFQSAIKLYRIIIRETDDPNILEKMGCTLVNLEAWEESIQLFKNILISDPNHDFAKERLNYIYKVLIERADQAAENKLFRKALDFYQTAITIQKTIENMTKLASIYRSMGNLEEHNICLNEIKKLELEEYRRENEKKWKQVVQKAQKLLKEKKYIESFKVYESSFEIKPDKKTYLYLCQLYKKMKYQKALEKLVEKWNMLYRHQIKGG